MSVCTPKSFDLTGKVALITGASYGIGFAIATAMANCGATIVFNDIKQELVDKGLAAYKEAGINAHGYVCDVTNEDAVNEMVKKITEEVGHINVLVNNAGITQDGLLAMMKEESFDRVLDVDLKGAFNFIRHCTPLFLRQKGGAIVNITSVSGMIGNPGQANYAAAKAGLIGLTKAVAKELAPKGITCNAVAPGFIATDMTRDLAGQDNALLAAIPLGRMGQPQEVAQAVAFLATAPYITGEVLRVDGGIAM